MRQRRIREYGRFAGISRVEPTEVNANRFARLAGGRLSLEDAK
jgi:hypothetical protein